MSHLRSERKLLRAERFMDQPGADPSAVMKGDNAQHVDDSTAPGTPVRTPNRPGPRGYLTKGGTPFRLPTDKAMKRR
jgi:hypothetical protein